MERYNNDLQTKTAAEAVFDFLLFSANGQISLIVVLCSKFYILKFSNRLKYEIDFINGNCSYIWLWTAAAGNGA